MPPNADRDEIEPNLTDRAYATIKSRLINLALPPGATFTEASLAKDLGISKTPIREALARVRREGLVEATARSGYHVNAVTLKDARDLFALRALLEAEAAGLAAKHMPDPKVLIALDRLCRASYNPRDPSSVKTYMRKNTEFHLTIARASGNAHLAAILEDLLDHVERLYNIGLTLTSRHEEIVHEHSELVRAIVAGNEKLARDVAHADMEKAHRTMLDALVTSPSLLSANVVSILPAPSAPRKAARRPSRPRRRTARRRR